MQFDWDVLRRARDEGALAVVPHPDDPDLSLLNYTARAQYGQAWDAYPVLLDCRGTIVDRTGRVVAKPFRKFFNVGERPETRLDRLATLGEPEVTHKLDGSMCTLYPVLGGYRLATRGSFTSAQALMATEIWDQRYAAAESRLDPGLTLVFELVGPANRIVVQYAADALVLIGAVETESGRELSYADIQAEASRLGLPCVEQEPGGRDWPSLTDTRLANFEGYVLFWPDHGLRAKVKLEEYVRLHRIISGLDEHAVWQHLREGASLEAVREVVPAEMLVWLDGTAARLIGAHDVLCERVQAVVDAVLQAGLDPRDRAQRREVARIVLSTGDGLHSAVFAALDGKDDEDILWRMLEPRRDPAHQSAPAAGVEPDVA